MSFMGGSVSLVPGSFWEGRVSGVGCLGRRYPGVKYQGSCWSAAFQKWRPLQRSVRILLECFHVLSMSGYNYITVADDTTYRFSSMN